MATPLVIALDAMGGDHGPEVVIPGAELSLIRHPDITYRLYGDDDLTVVDFAFSPAPVATLIAQAMQPIASPMSAYLTRRPDRPQAATPEPGAQEGRAAGGQVISEGRLNVRAAPAADGSVVGQLEPGSALVALGRSADGAWVRVQQGEVAGWAAAQFVRLTTDPANLPVLP